MRRIGVTGGHGFLGWHLRVLARSRGDIDLQVLDRETCDSEVALARAIDGCERVVHLAGANRGVSDDVNRGNVGPAQVLAEAVRRCERPPLVAFANSSQCGNGSAYGTAKLQALDALRSAGSPIESGVLDARLPNLFGEHGRPFYNSVVATFSHQLARGEQPTVLQDRSLDLTHANTAATLLLDAAPEPDAVSPLASSHTVTELLATLSSFAAIYGRAEIPPLPDQFSVDLFNTYRSFCPPLVRGLPLQRHTDGRGSLVEAVKAHGSSGQCFFSTSHPGVTRGQHYHLRKVERFLVLEGEALISLRRACYDEVVSHRVSGVEPVAVDMPTMWVHNITNVGPGPLLTLFWTNDLFDPAAPDTYAESV